MRIERKGDVIPRFERFAQDLFEADLFGPSKRSEEGGLHHDEDKEGGGDN